MTRQLLIVESLSILKYGNTVFFLEEEDTSGWGSVKNVFTLLFCRFSIIFRQRGEVSTFGDFYPANTSAPNKQVVFSPPPPPQKMGSYITILPPHNHSDHFHLSPRWPLCRGSAVFKFAHRAQMSTSLTPLLYAIFALICSIYRLKISTTLGWTLTQRFRP